MTTKAGEAFQFPGISVTSQAMLHCPLSFMGAAVGFGTVGVNMSSWTVSNYSAADRTVAADEATAANIAASLATLIKDLQQRGILG